MGNKQSGELSTPDPVELMQNPDGAQVDATSLGYRYYDVRLEF